MTFRQVVLQQLWNFELVIFIPGSERNMEDLEKPREVCHFALIFSMNVFVDFMFVCNIELSQ